MSAISRLAIALQTGIPSVWIGKPGIGKTAIADDLACQIGLGFVSVSAAYMMPEDVSGLPVPNGGQETKRIYDSWAFQAHKEPTLLLIDEVNRCPSMATMNAFLRIAQERLIGDLELHPDSRILYTANPADTDAGARELPCAFANRVYHESGEVEFDAWQSWMLGGTGATEDCVRLKADWANEIPMARARIMGFLNARRSLEYVMPKDNVLQGGAWPSRRSWDNASRILAGCMSANIEEGTRIELLTGIVGAGAAIEYFAWSRNADLPDPETIIADPNLFPVDGRADRMLACMFTVAVAARSNPVDKAVDAKANAKYVARMGAFVKVIERLIPIRKDMAVVGFYHLCQKVSDGKHPRDLGVQISPTVAMAMQGIHNQMK